MSVKREDGDPARVAAAARDLLAALPHRHPLLMIDRVLDRLPGRSCRALKRVSAGDPLSWAPGPAGAGLSPFLLVEAMSQAAALAFLPAGGEAAAAPAVGYLAAVRDFRARAPVVPGDTLTVQVAISGRFGRLVRVEGTVERDGEELASAQLTLTLPGEADRR